MLQYVLRRVLWMVPTLIGITFFTVVITRLAPGDPASVKVGFGGEQGMSAELGGQEDAAAKFRREHLLDRNLLVQWLHYVGPFDLSDRGHPWFGGSGERSFGGLLLLDFKNEYFRPATPVLSEIRERLEVTVPLALSSALLSYLISLPIGIWSVVRQGTRRDAGVTVVLFLLYSVPAFWAGLMLQLLFGANWLGWFPVLGLHDRDIGAAWTWPWIWDLLWHSVLPLATLTYTSFAYLSRQMRAGMIDVIRQDYVRTARAKGLSERVVVLKHALRNSLIPVITLFASILPSLIGGALVVEVVFDLPGMGRYAFEGLLSRDYNIVMATTTCVAVMTLLGFLLSDITYALVDPRISYD